MRKVFLGGTINGSGWRETVIPQLKIDYFNPVVPEWTDEAYKRELEERENCEFCLYVLTPKMTGVYSVAEVVDDSNKRPDKTIFTILVQDDTEEFSEFQVKSLIAVGKMVRKNGARWFATMDEVIEFLNNDGEEKETKVSEKLLRWFKQT